MKIQKYKQLLHNLFQNTLLPLITEFPFYWTEEHGRLFQQLKTTLTSEKELTIPNTKHTLFISVNASIIGLRAVIFQPNGDNTMKVNYQKLSTLGREFLGTVHRPQILEFLIIGPHIQYMFLLTIHLFYIVLQNPET